MQLPAALPLCEKQSEYAGPWLDSTDVTTPVSMFTEKTVYSLEELIVIWRGKNNILDFRTLSIGKGGLYL